MNRRNVLKGLSAASIGSMGLAFGSGAFTETTATRDFTVSLSDSDRDSQLVIEPSGELDSNAAKIMETEGGNDTFRINTDGVSPNSTTTFGEFGNVDIDDPGSLQTPLFVIRNENATGVDVDIEVGLSFAAPEGTRLGVYLNGPEAGTEITDSQVIGGETPDAAVVNGVPSLEDSSVESEGAAQVGCGLIVESAGSGSEETVEGIEGNPGIEVTATKSGGDR